MSTNAVAARVRRMERAGVILGYTVRTSAEAPDAQARPAGALEVFIDVRLDATIDSEAFIAKVAVLAQVVDAAHVTGPFDLLLRAFVADTGALDLLLRRLKQEFGVAQTQTRVALRRAAPDAERGGEAKAVGTA